jgi:hypothetical protein
MSDNNLWHPTFLTAKCGYVFGDLVKAGTMPRPKLGKSVPRKVERYDVKPLCQFGKKVAKTVG